MKKVPGADEDRETSVVPIAIGVGLVTGAVVDNWVIGVLVGAAAAAGVNALRKRRRNRRRERGD